MNLFSRIVCISNAHDDFWWDDYDLPVYDSEHPEGIEPLVADCDYEPESMEDYLQEQLEMSWEDEPVHHVVREEFLEREFGARLPIRR